MHFKTGYKNQTELITYNINLIYNIEMQTLKNE